MRLSYLRNVAADRLFVAPLRGFSALLVVVGLAACANLDSHGSRTLDRPDCGGPRPGVFLLNVEYEGGCPERVIPATGDNGCAGTAQAKGKENVLCVCRSEIGLKSIQWQSAPGPQDYEVIFDPFQSMPLKSKANGTTVPQHIDRRASRRPKGDSGNPPESALLEFKYTIADLDPECPLLDPRIIVGN